MRETVFFLEAAEKCTPCNGTGVDVQGERIDKECPHCDGKGWFDTYSANLDLVPQIAEMRQQIDDIKKDVKWNRNMIEIMWKVINDK